jgi:Protein of unknown function (DUF3626)
VDSPGGRQDSAPTACEWTASAFNAAEVHVFGRQALHHVAGLSAGQPVDRSLRVTLNFHPDRGPADRPTLWQLAESGTYLAQFVTGTSSGGLTAFPGGDRWRWEQRMFAGAYDSAPAHLRPVYGALNFRNKLIGAAPRFGSAYLRLTGAALARATFCYPDSYLEPTDFGVADRMALVDLALSDRQDSLDDYIEAHVHGPVRLDRDVEALVLDPSYRGTDIETIAAALPCPLEWHPGLRLSVTELRRHRDYRGQRYVDLGVAIALDGSLDPRIIGDAARSGRYDEQDLKRVWHYLARFGMSSPRTQ